MNSGPQHLAEPAYPYTVDMEQLQADYQQLLEEKHALELGVQKDEERRRAFIPILSDLHTLNRKLADQRKAMIHILADYEQDRSRLAGQTERLDNSRRALLHLLQDSHQANLRLEQSRKAMIHIMSDLKETTEEIQRREQELREKQEQLVQAGKLATLGELTTGVAHELNNPLDNIGLFVGNAMDHIELGVVDANPGVLATWDIYSGNRPVLHNGASFLAKTRGIRVQSTKFILRVCSDHAPIFTKKRFHPCCMYVPRSSNASVFACTRSKNVFCGGSNH